MTDSAFLAERERGFEAKFVHDEDLHFRILARRDRYFASQIASLLGLDAAAADALLAQTLHSAGGPTHDETILGLAAAALVSHGHPADPTDLHRRLQACQTQAHAELIPPPV